MRRIAFLTCLGLAGACLNGPAALAADAPAGPATACKEQYDTEARFLSNPDENILIAAVVGWVRTNKTRLLWDERYANVARQWSGYLLESGLDPERMIPVDRLRFELRLQGVTDARVEPFSAEGAVEQVPPGLVAFLDQEAKKGRFTHFAVGVARTRDQKKMFTTLLLGRRPALLDPVPICPAPASRLKLRARLLRGYHHPSWLLTTPGGGVLKDSLGYEEGSWHGEVPLDGGRGEYQLEVVVHGPAGPEVAALFPLYVGTERPRIPTVKLRPAPVRYRTPEDAEKAMVDLVNQARTRLDLPALVFDERLSEVARDHAMGVLAKRHAVHRTTASGALQDRLRKSGVPFARALENVSLSSSPGLAHQRFMESPGHRLNVLDPHVTHLGVGIAMERGSHEDILAVCEVFVESVESTDLVKVTERIAGLINAKRKEHGRFALGVDRELSREALRSARRLAALGDQADAKKESVTLVEELTEGDLEVPDARVRFFRTSSLRSVLSSEELLDEDINRLGIGLARTGNRSRPDEVWIALIFAGR